MAHRIFVSRKIPVPGIEMLKEKGWQVEVFEKDQVIPREVLLEKIQGADALLCLLTDKIDSEVLDAAGKSLKIVANYAVGFDNIDLKAAKERGVLVTNTPEVLTQAVAEHTVALIFAVARRIAEADRFTRTGKYRGWEPELLLGVELKGKTLGVVGLGRIGSAVAQAAYKGLGMKIRYFDVKRNEDFEKALEAQYGDLPELLANCDVISIHVPLLPQTRHLISERELSSMKKTAILVNTSRGPVVDEAALVKALREKQIFGAGLDVYENEPELTLGLSELDNIVITPHTASATIEARSAMSKLAAENIIAALEGRTPPNLVEVKK